MASEAQIQIDEDGNVDGASESGYTQDGKKILVGVLFRGETGFKITNPPSGYAVGTSFFIVPGNLHEDIEEALTSFLPADENNSDVALDKQRTLSKALNGFNRAYIPTGKEQKEENKEIATLYRYENKFLPRLQFVRDQRTLMPQWLAEIFVSKAPDIFFWAPDDPESPYYQHKYSHLAWVKGYGPDDYDGTLLTGKPNPNASPTDEDPLAIPSRLARAPAAVAVPPTPPAKGGKGAK